MAEDRESNSKVIVITGVTSGLGRALLEEFVRLGHFVVGCGRRKDRLDALTAEFGPKSVLLSTVDTTLSDQVESWARAAHKALGERRVDLLINNSGVNASLMAPLWEVPEKDCVAVMNTNVLGYVNVIRAFVPRMVQANHGVIVNVSSGQGRAPNPLLAVYSMSKWAVESMSKSVAMSLPSNMCCTPWAPGIIRTEMNPSKKFPTTDGWVKDAVILLLSLNNSHNGQSIHTKGYYPDEVMKDWIITDGSFINNADFNRKSKL